MTRLVRRNHDEREMRSTLSIKLICVVGAEDHAEVFFAVPVVCQIPIQRQIERRPHEHGADLHPRRPLRGTLGLNTQYAYQNWHELYSLGENVTAS